MKNKGKKKLKNILSVALALTMLLTAVPMSVSAAAAEELSETTEKVSNAVESAGASLGYMMLDAVTEVGRQNLQQVSIVNDMIANATDTVVSAADTLGNAMTCAATEETYGDFKYRVLDDGTAEITDYTGSATDIVIPSEMNGYKVTSIGTDAFFGCNSLKNIEVSGDINSIGNYAFSGCNSLKEIEVSGNVNSIGYNTFSGCNSLISVKIEGILKNIGESAFFHCDSLTTVSFSGDIENIESCAFNECNALTEFVFPGNVDNIGYGVFADCVSLLTVKVNGNVGNISKEAFAGCISLKSIEVNGNIENISEFAFSDDGIGVQSPYCTTLESVKINGYIGNIGKSAFFKCSSLKSIVALDGMRNIEDKAFAYCASLINIECNADMEKIGESVFCGCGSLKTVTIRGGVDFISDYAFSDSSTYNPSYCISLEKVKIDGDIGTLGLRAFFNCSELDNIEVVGNITNICDETFSDCNSLINITIHGNINSLNSSMFIGCNLLKNVEIAGDVEKICKSTFSENCSNLEKVIIGGNVGAIETYAFYKCGNLLSIEINGDVGNIGKSAFSQCNLLKNVEITGDVGDIGSYAFSIGCSGLENVNIGGSVNSFGDYVFFKSSLKIIEIGGSVGVIGDDAFRECVDLEAFKVGEDINSIGKMAFNGCASLKSVDIHGNVGDIGNIAFEDCDALTDVAFGGNVGDIEKEAFYGCDALNSITFSGNVGNIKEKAFYSCKSLENIKIQGNVESIGTSAFSKCISLTDMVILGSVGSIGNSAFSECSKIRDFVIPANVTNIESGTFENCASLSSVTLPSSLISIGENAFYKCSSLRDIYYGGTKKEWENIDKASSRLPSNVTVHYSSNGAEAALSDYYVGTVEDANGNYAESWIKISGTIYPVSKQLFIVPEYMVGRKILYRLNSNGEIAKYSLETDPKIAKIKSYNPENQTLEIEGETTPCYLYKGLTDEDLMGESDLSNAVALVGRLVRYTTAPVYDDMGRQVVCLINADLIRTVAGKIKSLDVLSNPWQVYMEGANKAIPVDMSNESLQNELLNLQQKDAILTLVDGVICYAYDPLSLTSVNIVYSSVNPEEIEWKDKKYSADTIESTVTISFGFKSTSFVGESDVAKNYLKNESIILDRIDVSLVNLDMYKIDGNEVCESGTTINFGNSKSYTLKLKLKLFAGKPEHETDTGFIYVDVYTSSLSKKVSYPIDIQNIDLQEENRKKKEELEQKAQEEAKKMAKEAENAYAKLIDNGEETLFAFPPELYEYLDDDQIKSIELIILTQIALSKIPEEELSSDNDEIKKISDEIVEKVMNKYLGDWKPDVSVSSLNVPVLIQLESEKYGTIQCTFDCNLTNVSLKEKEFAMQGDFSVKVRLMDKNGKPTKNIPTKGIIVQTDIKSFADSIWNIASGQFKSAINILWGNDANKITNEIKQNGINAVANKMSPYIFNKPIQLILQKFYEKELKNSFSSNMYKILSYPSKLVSVHCPVDLYIYDASGALAGSIINGEALSFTDDLSLWTDGDSKYVQMYGGDYQIVYMSTDSGTMDIEITEYANSDMNVQTVYFKNVPLDNGILYAGNIEETLNTQNKDYNLVSNFGNVIESDSIIENVPEEDSKLPGDINGDGKVTAVDARWVLQIAAGTREVTEAERISVDLNGDGKVTAVDARWVLQIAAGTRVL